MVKFVSETFKNSINDIEKIKAREDRNDEKRNKDSFCDNDHL